MLTKHLPNPPKPLSLLTFPGIFRWDKPGQARTDKTIVASAYFVRSAELVAQAAETLGRTDERQHYLSLAENARAAFAREYITPAGRLMNDATTAPESRM